MIWFYDVNIFSYLVIFLKYIFWNFFLLRIISWIIVHNGDVHRNRAAEISSYNQPMMPSSNPCKDLKN